MAFAPYDPTLRQRLQQAPAPADDWHAQWGGTYPGPMAETPQASGPGGGDPARWAPVAGVPMGGPTYDDAVRAGGGGVIGPQSAPGTDAWYAQHAVGQGPAAAPGQFTVAGAPGGYTPWSSGATMAPYSGVDTSQPPPPAAQSGGFTPLSQIGRGLGRIGGALGLPGFGGGNKPPAAPQQTAPGPWMPQQGAPGGGMVLLRAPNGQTRQVPAAQVDHYLARGATRG